MIAVRMFQYANATNPARLLEAGEVFRVVKDSNGVKITYCLVENVFYIDDNKYIEMATLANTSYGTAAVERKTARWDDDFFTNMQHADEKEALRVLGTAQIDAEKAVLDAERNLLNARRISTDFTRLAEFILTAGF